MANRFSEELKFRSSLAKAQEKVFAILDLFGWKDDGGDADTITARTAWSAFGLGEYVTISFLQGDRMVIESESINPFQFFDLGKNQSNVEKFIEAFRNPRLPIEEKERSVLDRFFSGK